MGSQGFRNIAGNPFVYQEDTRSAAFGLDASAQTWKIAVLSTTGALPTSTAQIIIDPATDGNVTIDPNGAGNLSLTSGNVSIVAGNLALPTTSSTAGQVTIGGTKALHTYGTLNIFVGDSGNFTFTGNGANVGVGASSLIALTSGEKNVCVGANSGGALTTGSFNCTLGMSSLYTATTSILNLAIGYSSLYGVTTGDGNNIAIGSVAGLNLTTGANNILIGGTSNYPTTTTGAGTAYTSSESSNIIIHNAGVVGESNKIRIGTTGTGVCQQDACYIAGIYNITPGATIHAALIDSNGQLGSVASLGVANGGTGAATLTDHGILLGSGTSAITATAAPTDGQLLIGYTGADPSLATLTASTNITVTNASGSITLSSVSTTLNTQTDDYELVLTDAGKLIQMNKGTANTLTVPKNSSVAYATGTQILVAQIGAGQTTVSPVDGDVTIYSSASYTKLYGQYSMALLVKTDTDTWILAGDITS